MTILITARNVNKAYVEAMWKLKIVGHNEETRNGTVKAIQEPVVMTITDPWERVLFNKERNANPFFHVMEFIWMMAGSDDAAWISFFNSRMMDYADDGYIRGAYGKRWQTAGDQIAEGIAGFKKDPTSRQFVVSMWEYRQDGPREDTRDRPCNTHIYFRKTKSRLDMMVCNRSNDVVWGMLGSNVVHFTLLHELVAHAVGLEMGYYRVMTNNLHIYEHHWHLLDAPTNDNQYELDIGMQPILQGDETWADLRQQCETLVKEDEIIPGTRWFNETAMQMYFAYIERKGGLGDGLPYINQIVAEDWRVACQQWVATKSKSVEATT